MSNTHLICPQIADTSLPDRLAGLKYKVQKGNKGHDCPPKSGTLTVHDTPDTQPLQDREVRQSTPKEHPLIETKELCLPIHL